MASISVYSLTLYVPNYQLTVVDDTPAGGVLDHANANAWFNRLVSAFGLSDLVDESASSPTQQATSSPTSTVPTPPSASLTPVAGQTVGGANGDASAQCPAAQTLQSALPANTGSVYEGEPVKCQSGWAIVEVLHDGNAHVQLFHMRSGAWTASDRQYACAVHQVPAKLYAIACESD